ncbi:MAG: DUF4301 family protein [Bacteroidota bacterium]
MFSQNDLQQLENKGISLEMVKQQLSYFREGFPFTKVTQAARVGEGILQLSEAELATYTKVYEEKSKSLEVCKFVPASGAASRMFKALFAYVDSEENIEEHPKAKEIVLELDRLAFRADLAAALQQNGHSLDDLIQKREYRTILAALLKEHGLDYGNLPKGLLQFHDYGGFTRTPIEEHLVEGANYCQDEKGNVHLHFTVSTEHQEKFEELLAQLQSKYESQFGVHYQIGFSQQQARTDTIAVDENNQPFRLEDNSILFRPGGHGALLDNLDALDFDLVFIKNIDNVVPDHLKETTYQYKKALGGVLLKLQEKIFGYVGQLKESSSAATIKEIEAFLKEELFIRPPSDYQGYDLNQKRAFLYQKLNRPIRVCGMVKNEGEPGGGPFFAENPDQSVSLHIVESAQIDKDNDEQLSLLKISSHFNPVDLVCSLKDDQGKIFDLKKYVNPRQGFISNKSKEGRPLKALELPGLWNGSMADWNTIFVEVPILTFNPVKQVNDLLREAHQML